MEAMQADIHAGDQVAAGAGAVVPLEALQVGALRRADGACRAETRAR
jgi:hypothetical protein